MIDTAWNAFQDKMIELAEQERGDGGGNGLTAILLTVGGVLAAGVVVAAIATAVSSNTGNLTP